MRHNVMNYTDNDIDRLLRAVERVAGKSIVTPRDFTFLSRQIESYTGEVLSVSTLKRLWGYVSVTGRFSRHSLDVLASMVGYERMDDFGRDTSAAPGAMPEPSHKIVRRKLRSADLSYGDVVTLVWRPNRVVTLRYEGRDVYEVIASENSKLCVGDTFHCPLFVDHEPLLLLGLHHPGIPVCDYACGTMGGVVWRVK